MTERELIQNINKLCAGYTFVGKYIVDIPSTRILVEADNVYNQFLFDNRFENILDQEKMNLVLIKKGMWSFFEQKELEDLPKEIENAKLDLYIHFLVPSNRKRIKERLEKLKTKYNELMSKKDEFYRYTLECLAEMAMERYIFSKTILNKKYKRIRVSPAILDKIVYEFKKQQLSLKEMREIARSDYWQSVWSIKKLRAFRKIGEQQMGLINYTQLYHNISKHPEAPNSEVISDDDALDGWLIYIRNEQTRNKKQQDFEKSKIKGKGNEHFIMVKDQQDVENVLSMNDARGRIIQKKIHKMTQEGGVANEYNIQEIRQNANLIRK